VHQVRELGFEMKMLGVVYLCYGGWLEVGVLSGMVSRALLLLGCGDGGGGD